MYYLVKYLLDLLEELFLKFAKCLSGKFTNTNILVIEGLGAKLLKKMLVLQFNI